MRRLLVGDDVVSDHVLVVGLVHVCLERRQRVVALLGGLNVVVGHVLGVDCSARLTVDDLLDFFSEALFELGDRLLRLKHELAVSCRR